MRRKPLNTASRSRLSKYARPLAQVAILLAEAGSRGERRFWKRRLFATVAPMLEGRSDLTLTQTLDHLYDSHIRAYDELAFAIENCVESPVLEAGREVLLIAAPVLAWSNYSISSGKFDMDMVAALTKELKSHVLAEHVELTLADFLFSPDQLPESYTAAAELARQLGRAVLDNQQVTLDIQTLPDTQNFLSDARYLIGSITVPEGLPMFRWQQETPTGSLVQSRDEVLKAWKAHASSLIQKLLPGCSIEILLPNGLYSVCRQAEREARAYSVKASIAFLSTAVNLQPSELIASVGAFVERGEVEEYRIGFCTKESSDIIHGVVWPLLGEEYGNEPDPVYENDLPSEPDNPIVRARIETLLKEVGINKIHMLEERFPLEYCEDCGAPIYPNPEGELMHAELPEEAGVQTVQLH